MSDITNNATLLNSSHIYMIALSGLIACVGFFDFSLFIYLSDIFNQAFFLNWLDGWQHLKINLVFLASYIAMPVGGFLIGRYGDKHGRKLALSISLIGVGIFTLITSILPTTKELNLITMTLFGLARFGQGLALGGLIPSIWVFISEHLPTKYLGVGGGITISSSLLGALLAFIFVANLENTLTQEQITSFGWRLPFLIGGSLTCFLLLLAKALPETPIFTQIHTPNYQEPNHPISSINLDDPTRQEMDILINRRLFDNKANDAVNPNSSMHALFKKYVMCFLPSLILSWKTSSLFIIIAILLPNLLNMGFVVRESYLNIGGVISMLFMILGSIFYGFLTDRFNAGRVIIIGNLFLILQIMLFFGHLKAGGELILVFFALLGFACGVIASAPVVIVRLFPAKIRLFGVALTFNTALAFAGGLLPFLLSYATFHWRLAPALYLTFVVLASLFISFHIYYLPRTDADLER